MSSGNLIFVLDKLPAISPRAMLTSEIENGHSQNFLRKILQTADDPFLAHCYWTLYENAQENDSKQLTTVPTLSYPSTRT
jgi:hypothetical protein